MPATIVQSKAGAIDTPATSFTVAFDTAVTPGNVLIITVASGSTMSTPAGFTVPTGGSQVGAMAHYYFYRSAANAQSSFTITQNASRKVAWSALEVSGLDISGGVVVSNGSFTNTGTANYATPSVNVTAGARFITAALSSYSDTTTGVIGAWSNGFVEVTDSHSVGAGADNFSMAVSTLSETLQSTTARSTGATYTGNTPLSNSSSIVAFDVVNSNDTTPPSVPTNVVVTKRTNTTVTLNWTASTDDTAVTGYNIYLNGSSTAYALATGTTYTLTGLAAITTYTVTIKAHDAAGNLSAASSVLSIKTLEGSGRYYWDGTAKHLVNFKALAGTGGGGTGNLLSLPRVAWEGGPAYWAQFSKAAAAGWTDPTFFPMMSFSNSFSSDAEIAWDKDHGINVYHGLNPFSPWDLLPNHDMHYVGDPYAYNGDMMPANFANWVGYNTPDEIDGTSNNGPSGVAQVTSISNGYRAQNDGRYIAANYTQTTIMTAFDPYGQQYINHTGVDAVSIDMYWYTIPNSSFGNTYYSAVNGPANPRSATSYGAMVRGMRQINDLGPKKKPMWMFVECLSGSPGEQFVRNITPGELKGAVMSSIINEARGIMWFNNVASQGHEVGNVLRQAQVQGNSFVGATQIAAMKEVNAQVRSLATVINTQSYVWNFGTGLETMLKAAGGFAYIFAMAANNTATGSRTFTLPSGITGTTITVVDEARTITRSGNTFTDSFAAEYSYHIYKIAI